jgi:hypothetical protein
MRYSRKRDTQKASYRMDDQKIINGVRPCLALFAVTNRRRVDAYTVARADLKPCLLAEVDRMIAPEMAAAM